MKKMRTIIAATLTLLCATLQAQDFYAGGLYYNILSESEKTVEVTNCDGGDSMGVPSKQYRGNIIIPENVIYNGIKYEVVAIGNRAFWCNDELHYVTLPSCVRSIGERAFYYSSLWGISDSKFSNIESIGELAFYGCSGISEFIMPETTTSIGKYAFGNCQDLRRVVIGKNVTEIGEGAFDNSAIADIFSYIPADKLFALTNPGDITSNATLVVPTGAQETYAAIDGWKDFANIVEEKKEFNDGNFKYNVLSYKNNTVEISIYKHNEEVIIPPTVEHDGTTYTVTRIARMGFSVSSVIKRVSLPNTITEIAVGAFIGLPYFEEVTLPSSLVSIEDVAFGQCGLKTVNIPASVKKIGRNPFANCAQLESINVEQDNTRFYDCSNNLIMDAGSNSIISGCKNTIFGILFSNGINLIIEPWAFSRCTGLTEITFPSNHYISIREYAFNECTNLNSITLPDGVEYIGQYAFNGCTNLNSIALPDGVEYIGQYAFNECNLNEFFVPASVTSFWASALDNNPLLETITVDEENTVYDSRDNCNAIIATATNTLVRGCNSTIIPDTITAIEEHAFYGCSGLTQVTLPAGITSIGEYAFSGCSGLRSITSLIPADRLEEVEVNAWGVIDYNNCVLIVPEGAQDAYSLKDPWNSFHIVEPGYRYFDLNVSAAGYATLFLDYHAYIPNGVELYTASSVDGNRLMMEQVEYGILPANTGVLVKAEQGTYTFIDTYDTINGYIENNLFRGSAEDVYITPAKEAKYYVLAMKDGVVGMYEDALSGGTFKNNANKAYLVLGEKNLGIYDEEVDTEDPGMQLSNSYYFDFSGTTAVEEVVTENEEKIYYDLSGRRIQNPTRGIYILNGRKVLVK
ncbi:MAG: leucine-rich repeat domain-containing protein [Bacteroidaceae bacterium]|nr:leucine-rich repeat domain-containing protein [Bacteroidaceae bacterium]